MFDFCPRCQTTITQKFDRLIDCTHCGFHYYLAPALTNALIIENEKREILLVKRKGEPKKGLWDLPGGFVDYDETLEDSTRREIKEELNLDIKEIKYLTSTIDHYLYKTINYHTICSIFVARLPANQQIKVHDDIDGFRFFPKDKIPFEKLAFEGLVKAIKEYLKISNYSN